MNGVLMNYTYRDMVREFKDRGSISFLKEALLEARGFLIDAMDILEDEMQLSMKIMPVVNELETALKEVETARINKKRSDKENGFVVSIVLQGPTGEWDNVGYADWETSIDYNEGIYGYDSDPENYVSPMTKEDAEALADEIKENAPAGEVKVYVVPYNQMK